MKTINISIFLALFHIFAYGMYYTVEWEKSKYIMLADSTLKLVRNLDYLETDMYKIKHHADPYILFHACRKANILFCNYTPFERNNLEILYYYDYTGFEKQTLYNLFYNYILNISNEKNKWACYWCYGNCRGNLDYFLYTHLIYNLDDLFYQYTITVKSRTLQDICYRHLSYFFDKTLINVDLGWNIYRKVISPGYMILVNEFSYGIVSNKKSKDGLRYLIIFKIGNEYVLCDYLRNHEIHDFYTYPHC
jgi:hypothetical protein